MAAGALLPRLDRRAHLHPQRVRALRPAGRARNGASLVTCGSATTGSRATSPERSLPAAAAARRGRDAASTSATSPPAVGSCGMSGGTRASAAGAMTEPSFAWRGGIRTERGAMRRRSVRAPPASRARRSRSARQSTSRCRRSIPGCARSTSISAGSQTRAAMQAMSAVNHTLLRIPGLKSGLDRLVDRFVPTSTGGPDRGRAGPDSARRSPRSPTTSSRVGAGRGARRQRLHVHRPRARLGRPLRWQQGMEATGALGPASAFGLDRLEAGCAEAGIARVD